MRTLAVRPDAVVELAGIPGSGKSHLAMALAVALEGSGVDVRQPLHLLGPSVPASRRLPRKVLAATRAVVRDPGVALAVHRGLLASGQPGGRDLLARELQWHTAQHMLGPRDAGVTVLDEGLVQCLWSIGLRGDVEPVLRALAVAPRWRAPDLLVVVRTPVAVAAGRLGRRASRHSRVQQLRGPARVAELAHGDALLDQLVQWWAGSAAGAARHVVEVGGSLTAADVTCVLAALPARSGGAASPG